MNQATKGAKMSKPWLSIALLLFIINFPIVKYGTITPCGILKEQFKSEMFKDFVAHTGGGPNWEQNSSAIWLKVGNIMIDDWFRTLSPIDCVKGLARGDSYGTVYIQQRMSRRRAQALREGLEKWRVNPPTKLRL